MTPESVAARLARIETKLDQLLRTRDDHEIRLRRIERWGWLVAGAAGAASGQAIRILGGG